MNSSLSSRSQPADILAQATAINKLKQLLTWQFAVLASQRAGLDPSTHMELNVRGNQVHLWLPASDIASSIQEQIETTAEYLESTGVDLASIKQEFEKHNAQLQAV